MLMCSEHAAQELESLHCGLAYKTLKKCYSAEKSGHHSEFN